MQCCLYANAFLGTMPYARSDCNGVTNCNLVLHAHTRLYMGRRGSTVLALTAMVWPCSSVFRVSSSLTLISSFTMFSWPTLRPAPFSTSLLRLEISSLSWLIVSFARTILIARGERIILVLVLVRHTVFLFWSACDGIRYLAQVGFIAWEGVKFSRAVHGSGQRSWVGFGSE